MAAPGQAPYALRAADAPDRIAVADQTGRAKLGEMLADPFGGQAKPRRQPLRGLRAAGFEEPQDGVDGLFGGLLRHGAVDSTGCGFAQ